MSEREIGARIGCRAKLDAVVAWEMESRTDAPRIRNIQTAQYKSARAGVEYSAGTILGEAGLRTIATPGSLYAESENNLLT